MDKPNNIKRKMKKKAKTNNSGNEKKHNTPKEVMIEYRKTPAYRTVYVDGVFGGENGIGMLDMQLFSVRRSIPVFPVKGKMKHLPERSVVVEEIKETNIIKEIEISVIMSMKNVEFLRNWLTKQLKKHKETEKKQNG